MEKLQQLTKYDKLADEIGIVDKHVFHITIHNYM